MMVFVPFHSLNDDLIYINIQHVTAICPTPGGSQILMSSGDAHNVKETPALARTRLQFEIETDPDAR
jgi:hypothetical protein